MYTCTSVAVSSVTIRTVTKCPALDLLDDDNNNDDNDDDELR